LRRSNREAEELLPFAVGRGTVFGAGPQGAAAGDERAVPGDDFLGVDGLVSHGRVDVAVAGDELGDVRRHAVHDGVGDQHPAEVVRGEPERLPGGVGEAGRVQGDVQEFPDRLRAEGPVL
jgi:hypothetical protein